MSHMQTCILWVCMPMSSFLEPSFPLLSCCVFGKLAEAAIVDSVSVCPCSGGGSSVWSVTRGIDNKVWLVCVMYVQYMYVHMYIHICILGNV